MDNVSNARAARDIAFATAGRVSMKLLGFLMLVVCVVYAAIQALNWSTTNTDEAAVYAAGLLAIAYIFSGGDDASESFPNDESRALAWFGRLSWLVLFLFAVGAPVGKRLGESWAAASATAQKSFRAFETTPAAAPTNIKAVQPKPTAAAS